MLRNLRLQSLDVYPSYMGGNTMLYGRYVWEFAPHHGLANGWGWVAQHRLIGEAIAGRPLVSSRDPKLSECVHHVDENPLNNDPANLRVMTTSAHRRYHTAKRMAERLSPINRQMAIDALAGRSLKDAAKLLKVDPMTMRNRWPDLLEPRKRRSPARIDEQKIALVLEAARLGQMTLKEAGAAYGMGAMTASRICKRHGVAWTRRSCRGLTGRKNRTYRGVPIQRP